MYTHCDGDLATLNICLGDEFSGGDVTFFRRDQSTFAFAHKDVGSCCFHDGKVRHNVGNVTKGKRITLIVKMFRTRELC